MRAPTLSLLISLLLVLCADAGRAAEPDDLYARAQAADERLELADALRGYEEALSRAPASRHALAAQARIHVLRTHAEGGFAPLAALEAVRRDPARAAGGAAIDGLVRAAEGFPPGPVRVEAWVLAAEAYAHRLGRPDDAIPLYRRVTADPEADPVLARKAARDLTALLASRGDLAAAAEAARVDPKLAASVAGLARRKHLHTTSIAALAIVALLALRTAAGEGRSRALAALRRSAPLLLGYAAYVALGGALLATGYEAGTGSPFLAFGAALAPILLLARAWSAAGSHDRAARAARAALCASGTLGAAFLVLEALDAAYLEDLGL